MSNPDFQLTLHMVASLDGYIATPDGRVDWMHSHDNYPAGVTLTEEKIAAYLDGIDAYIMGSKTYETALRLGWPYGDKPVTVLSSRTLPNDRATVRFYNGNIQELLKEQASQFQSVWLVGGAATAKSFLQAGLVDEVIVSFLPILLGGGTPFFDHIGQQQRLHLEEVTAYKDGMVEMRYNMLNCN